MLAALFLTFAKIGLFTFGGGYAMLSVIEHTCVTQKQWITHEDFMNITVIAESTPGPVAINCATFVGYKQKGTAGALAATAGVILPSFLIIFLISDVAIRMIRKMKKDPLSIGILAAACAVTLLINFFSWPVSTVVLLLAAALVSLAAFLTRGLSSGKEKGKGGGLP